MRTRHQKGYVYRRYYRWYVRYYDYIVQKDGSIKRVQLARSLAPVCYEYRTKRAVMSLVREFLEPINRGRFSPAGGLSIERFVEESYLPYISREKRSSTTRGYRQIWNCYLMPRCGTLRLRDFRTADGERLMSEIARQNDLSRYTLRHIKAFLSGVFKYAKRLGTVDGVNPVQDVSIPKARPGIETYAYSLEEIIRMISVLGQPAATVVATAAFTGMRKGELRGFLWENYNQGVIWVSQSVWESIVDEPKTQRSKSPVPVIGPLAKLLDRHREARGNSQTGFVFATRNGTALNLSNLAKRYIRPRIEREGIKWWGWHAFRRGLATNLHRLGVSDKTIQAILRHANISTTLNNYVKSVPADAIAAMRSLEEVCTKYAPIVGKDEKDES
jgi:integrase